jgi:hypothetical protein
MTTRRFEGEEALFIHPVAESAVVAGNATIGTEILEDLPSVNTIVAPLSPKPPNPPPPLSPTTGPSGCPTLKVSLTGLAARASWMTCGHWCDRLSIRQYAHRSYRW